MAGLVVWALSLATFITPLQAAAVSLSGNIFQPDGATPLQNAVVRLVNKETGDVLTSTPTDASGYYEFTEAPAGDYTVEVEIGAGYYNLDRSVRLGAEDTASISFTVQPQDDDGEGAPPPEGKKKRRGMIIAFSLFGAALLAIGVNNNKKDDEASPFIPTP